MTMLPEMPPSGLPSVEYSGRSLVDADAEHLKILSICWYVMSGLCGVFGVLPIIYITMGIAMLSGAMPSSGGGGRAEEKMLGTMLIAMGCVFIVFLWTIAFLAFLTGRSLARRKRLTLCYITSGIACLQIPIGTLLGVFTFIVLSRPTVRSLFQRPS